MPPLAQEELRERVSRLAAIHRPSASEGEARAAELIRAELEECGWDARLEREAAHGTYWWPVGIPVAAAAAAGASRSRLLGAVVGTLAAAAVTDDITGGQQLFRRRFLPQRITTNVVAELGPADAAETIVLVAHHDAAHSGLVFHPGPPRALLRRFPAIAAKAKTTPPTMWGAVGGPALVAAGSLLGLRRLRRLGTVLSAGYAAAMADIGLRDTVPGANDNLTGVAVLLSLARTLAEDPLPDTRLILLSTGSEESFMEGMQAFGRRHFPSLPPETTTFINLDTLGSPTLLVLEGEGMVWMNEYPKDLIALAHETARELGIEVYEDLRFRNSTDALIALRRGYRALALCSADEFKIPSNYHWPTDTADNVRYDTVADAARLLDELVRRAAATASRRGGSTGRARSTR